MFFGNCEHAFPLWRLFADVLLVRQFNGLPLPWPLPYRLPSDRLMIISFPLASPLFAFMLDPYVLVAAKGTGYGGNPLELRSFLGRGKTTILRSAFQSRGFTVLLRAALASKSEVRVFEGVEAAVGTTAVVCFVLARRRWHVAVRVEVFELAISGVARLRP